MRAASVIRGWCPDAWRPMEAGDGLIVRVRPPLGRMKRPQTLALCDAASAFGNGRIELTNRAALQLRGVRDADRLRVVERLVEAGLVDANPAIEARRMLLVTPDWQTGDDSHRIASEMLARAGELPPLPGKIGFAIDAGRERLLHNDPADFRIERGETGGLIVRVEGRPSGAAILPGEEVASLIALAHWFVETGGETASRAARHHVPLPDWASESIRPVAAAPPIHPGDHPLGTAYGLPFGEIEAHRLAALAQLASAIRLTPWRIVIAEDAAGELLEGFVTDPASPLLRVAACVGAPDCPQATVETRGLARLLAPYVAGRLHVSGCGKGCAGPAKADVVLTGRDGRFDLGFAARAGDSPTATGLDPGQLLARFGAPDALPV